MNKFYQRFSSYYSFVPAGLSVGRFNHYAVFLSDNKLFVELPGKRPIHITIWKQKKVIKKFLQFSILVIALITNFTISFGQNVSATWGTNGNSPWYTGANWAGSAYAGIQGTTSNAYVANFTSAFTNVSIGINMTTASLSLGAVSIDNTRITALSIGNSGATAGFLRMYGATVNGISNVIVRNNGSAIFTLQAALNGSMGVILNNATDNIINTDAAGGVTITSIISGSGSLTKSGSGTGLLTLSNVANTYSGKTTINSGFVSILDEGAFGANPGILTANQITLNGGGIQASTSNVTFNSNRGITLGTSGGTFDIASTFAISMQNVVAGAGNLTKSGAGSFVLTNANTYTGTTTVSAGTLQLNRTGGGTLISTGNVIVNGGALKVSADQTLNNLTMNSGNLTVDNGVTLTVNGTLDYFQPATITVSGTGKIVYGSSGILKYSGTGTKIAGAEFPSTGAPNTVNIDNPNGVTLQTAGSVLNGSLILTQGAFTIGAGGSLDLNGASLNYAGGAIAGNATGDLTVRGTTGGTITIFTNISLRNVTVDDSRTLALGGTNNINLSGLLSITTNAVFDNGGESFIVNGGGSISISGKFITRDVDGFTGSNTSIPSIVPVLNTGCTIEYGRAGDQSISIRSDYKNLRITGGGIKTLASASTVSPITGTVTIPDATTLDVANNTFGNASTNLTMTNGRFRMSGTSPKPDIDGAYNLSGNSVIEFYNSATAGFETIKGLNAASADILYNQIEVTGNKVKMSIQNVTLQGGGSFTVKSGGVFEINDESITGPSGTQTVTVENGGTFRTGDKDGFSGGSAPNATSVNASIENIVLVAGSTVDYSRDNNQDITNTIPYSNFTISGITGVKTAPAGVLTIQGNLVKSGASNFNPNKGTILLNGANQSFAGLTYNTLLLDVASTKTLTGNAVILDSLRIGNPFTNTATVLSIGNNDVTLRSVADTTAKVATVAASASISYGTGRFVVERFFKALRAWRLITLPLSTNNTANNTIFATWQNNGAASAGKGMFVTGPGASNPTPGADGLDYSFYNNYSLKRFIDNKYVNIGRTKDSLISSTTDTSANIGYFAFVRGDRSRAPDNTVIPNTNVTTLSGRGKLQTGRQTFAVNTDSLGSFTLIGNPYACPIDFKLTTKINVNPNRFVAYDPNINGVGVFVVMEDGGSGNFIPIDKPSSTQNNFIQSGQAILVGPASVGGNAALVFNETNKTVVNDNLNLFRPLGDLSQTFKTILNKRHDDGTMALADGVHVQLDDAYQDAIDFNDAPKLDNIAENLAIIRHNRILAVEKRPVFTDKDTLFYRLTNTTQREYQFEFLANNILVAPDLVGYLQDSYAGTETAVNLAGTSTINFTINSESGSANPGRFRLVFKGGGPLPVTYNNIKAWQKGTAIAVEWTVENEINISRYEIEKSVDGNIFSKVNTTQAVGANRSSTTYNWLDTKSVTGNNYYRIRSVDVNGKIAYSRTVNVKTGKNAPGISVYPNPVKDGIIGLQFSDMPAGQYNIRLINNLGQVILSKPVTLAGGSATQTITPNGLTVKGIYQLEIIHPNKTTTMLKVIN